jgi:hypothetical protein
MRILRETAKDDRKGDDRNESPVCSHKNPLDHGLWVLSDRNSPTFNRYRSLSHS